MKKPCRGRMRQRYAQIKTNVKLIPATRAQETYRGPHRQGESRAAWTQLFIGHQHGQPAHLSERTISPLRECGCLILSAVKRFVYPTAPQPAESTPQERHRQLCRLFLASCYLVPRVAKEMRAAPRKSRVSSRYSVPTCGPNHRNAVQNAAEFRKNGL
jgi:hypothetical protein